MTETGPQKAWEQVTLEVSLEMAAELEDRLGEVLPGSLVVEKNYGDLFPDELDQYRGPVTIRGYYPAAQSSPIRERILKVLKGVDCSQAPMFSPLQNQNWATAWQTRYHPIPLGERLIVVPAWLDNPQPDRLAVNLAPGQAFGSGTHPTTQLSLELLENCIAALKPALMIDVGCGSGILSIAAAILGVRQVLGVDIDPDAAEISSQNAAANQVSERTSFRTGSVRDLLKQGQDSLPPAPLVVANIIAPILESLFEEGLGDLVTPGGYLVLSGILEEQTPGILDRLQRNGFDLQERCQKEEWVGLVGVKRQAEESKEGQTQV